MHPPSEPTLRRTLQSVDPDELDRIVGAWLSNQRDGEAIAIDGKTLRGAHTPDGKAVHLMAAFLHKEGSVIAQNQIDSKSNEITALKPLLEPLDIQGKVVTMDVMHTQVATTQYLKEDKHADYVLIVKGNQPGLLQDIQALDDEDFSP
ncbi:MAG: ISAs1 family transposase [Bacillota bacterium]